VPTGQSEVVRGLLQGFVGCAGAAAASGSCSSGAAGAAGSVALNNLITLLLEPEKKDPTTGRILPRSLDEQQARAQLIATLTGALVGALGGNANDASVAGQVETENNYLTHDQLSERQKELKNCKSNQACVDEVTAKYAWLSAYQDLLVATACRGGGLPGCSRLRSEQKDYVDGDAFKNKLLGLITTSKLQLDDALRIDLLRTLFFLNGTNFSGPDLVVNARTRFMKENGITEDNYGIDALALNSLQAFLYARLPEYYATDGEKTFMTALGRSTQGQYEIAQAGLAGQRNTVASIATAQAVLGCTIVSAVCNGAVTVAAGVDCANDPGAVNCGVAAVGVAVPVVRAVRNGLANITAARQSEIVDLFNKANPQNSITIGSRSVAADTTNVGGAKIFDGVSDAEIFIYFQQLSGRSLPASSTVPSKGIRYTVVTPNGNFTLRNFSTSSADTGAKWTIEVPKTVTGTGTRGTDEIKFRGP
jgi:hypothetical protein